MKQILESGVENGGAERYYGIDIIKFLCSFLVVAIHVQPFSGVVFGHADVLNFLFPEAVCRIAVPFYFAASGFLLFRKMDRGQVDWERIKGYCFKLLRFYGLWSVLLLVGAKYHLWYLGATVVGSLCLALCFHRRMKFWVMALLAAALYAVGLLGDAYYGFLEPLRAFAPVDYAVKGYKYFFSVTRNGLFMGFPFLLMGAAFSVKKIRVKPAPAAAGFLGSLALLVLEACTLEKFGYCQNHNMYLSLLPATFFLFALATSVVLPKHVRYERMQIMGSLIYYMHVCVSIAVDLGFSLVMKYLGLDLYAYIFLTTVLATVAAAWLILRISGCSRFRWVQYLYR